VIFAAKTLQVELHIFIWAPLKSEVTAQALSIETHSSPVSTTRYLHSRTFHTGNIISRKKGTTEDTIGASRYLRKCNIHQNTKLPSAGIPAVAVQPGHRGIGFFNEISIVDTGRGR